MVGRLHGDLGGNGGVLGQIGDLEALLAEPDGLLFCSSLSHLSSNLLRHHSVEYIQLYYKSSYQ